MENNNNNNIDKYFIKIESMYAQGVGGFHIISSNKY